MDDNQSEQYDYQGSRYTPTKTSGKAIASLIAGIIGWILLPYIGAFVAIYYGHKAKREIRESEGTLTGDGLATVGLVLGYSVLVVGALAICIILGVTILGTEIAETFSDISTEIETWITPTP